MRAREPRKEPAFDWRTYDPQKIDFPTWLIDGLIPEQATCCLYGAPNTGKSFMALDMALAIATGRQWLELKTRRDVGKTKERGKVIYILDENPEGLHRRIAAWLDHQNIPRDDGPEELNGYFWIPVIKNLHLDHEKSLDALISQIGEICSDPALIIFDPLVSFMGGDENRAGDTQDLIKALRKIVETFKESRCSVLVVHHSGKEYSRGERGSSALRGGVETLLELNTVRLKVLKQRDAEKLPDIPVEFIKVTEPIPGQAVLVTEPTGSVTESEPLPTTETRCLGMVVERREELLEAKVKMPKAPPGNRARMSDDNDGQDRTATDLVPSRKLTVPQRRALKNRDAVLAAMQRLANGQGGKVLAAADIKNAVGKKFKGGPSTFYGFLMKLADPLEFDTPVLIKVGDGQYKLAAHLEHDNQKKPVHSDESLSDSVTSRPADQAASSEGPLP